MSTTSATSAHLYVVVDDVRREVPHVYVVQLVRALRERDEHEPLVAIGRL
jgi:hypothetical protein